MSEQETPPPKKQPMMTWERIPTDEDSPEHDHAIDWDRRSGKNQGLLRNIERLALVVKEPVNRLVGTSQLNPLYYSGTIAFFLFIVVAVTGLYTFLLYQYGYDVTYEAIEGMDRFFVSRIARTIHRYASGGLIIFGMLHAIRMFFMDRFRGPRWLAWAAGVATMAVLWLAGITGYWLLWDQSAQLITRGFMNLVGIIPGLATDFYFGFLAETVAAQRGWLLILLILVAHLVLSILAGVFYWLHIKRLTRPKFFPPPYWMVGMGVLLILAGILFPARLLPIADLSILPRSTPLDPVFLFYLPPSLREPTTAVLVLVIILGAAGLVAAFPWLFPRSKLEPVTIVAERCTGCQHCVHDCPYRALSMITRNDDSPYTLLAQVDKNLCVACGICIGSCDTLAISLSDQKPELLWQTVANRLKLAAQHNPDNAKPVKVVFTCERHAAHRAHRAHRYAHSAGHSSTLDIEDALVEIVPVTCVAMVNPGLMTHTLEGGASEVQVVGCPPNDCTNREGNVWMEERLSRTRAPKLKPSFKDAPLFTTWLAPDHFADAMPLHASTTAERKSGVDEQHPPTTFEQIMSVFSRRNLVLAAILLAIGLLVQVQFTYTPFSAYAENQAAIRLALRFEHPRQLRLEIDGEPIFEATSARVLEEILVAPGEHELQLTITTSEELIETPVNQTVNLNHGDAYRIEIDELFVPEIREEPPEEYDVDTLRNLLHESD